MGVLLGSISAKRPSGPMTYDEALKAMESGKRIRFRTWNDESYMELVNGRLQMNLGGRITDCSPREIEKLSDQWSVLRSS